MRPLKIWDMFLTTLIFIFLVSFPFERLAGKNIDLYYCLKIGFSLFYVIYLFYLLRKAGMLDLTYKNSSWKNIFLLLPTIIITFTNLFFALINRNHFINSFTWRFIYIASLTLLTAISEEIIFRFLIQFFINIRKRLLKIIACAGIFALFHIFNFITTLNPFELLRIVYAFGLGIVLGFIFEYGHNLYVCIGFHFLFNFLNNDIFTSIFDVSDTLLWIVNGVVFAAICGLYLLFIYLFYFKKKERFDIIYS